MARRSDHSREEIRAMALAEAQRIIAADGLAGLTARRVAGGIGYTVGTLYLVFRNLDDLILHVNAAALDDLHAALQAALADCDRAERRVLELALAYLRFATAYPRRWMAIYEHRIPGGQDVPDWFRDKVVASLSLVEQALAPHARHADARRVALAVRVLWGGVHGICMLGLTGKLDVAGPSQVETLVRALVTEYLRGFASH